MPLLRFSDNLLQHTCIIFLKGLHKFEIVHKTCSIFCLGCSSPLKYIFAFFVLSMKLHQQQWPSYGSTEGRYVPRAPLLGYAKRGFLAFSALVSKVGVPFLLLTQGTASSSYVTGQQKQIHSQCGGLPQIHKGNLRPPILPSVLMASSAIGLKLGVFKFLPTALTETNTKQMHLRSLHTVRCFMCVYLHAPTTVDASDICT